WRQISSINQARGVILDLRYCGGGYPATGLNIVSWLIGTGKVYNTIAPRNSAGTEEYRASEASAEGIEAIVNRGLSARLVTQRAHPVYSGLVAVLIGGTGSECEVVAATLQEHGRARLFGQGTEGAFNGWAVAQPLPYGAGSISIPVTASISPKGVQYEGKAVN